MKGIRSRRFRLVSTSIVAGLALGLAWTGSGQLRGATPEGFPEGYLGPERIPDPLAVLPPPPAPGSAIDQADLAIFGATRAQLGSERWRLATRDDAADPAGLLNAFSCALGVRLRPGDAPALEQLLVRAMADTFLVIGPPKDHYRRARPFLRAEGEVCVAITPSLSQGGGYPSGHATVGWVYGLILGEIAPDRASALLVRGRAYGESRVFCGVHYESDIEAGRTLAAALVAVLHSDHQFRTDLAAARTEFDALRARPAPANAPQCAIEQAAIAATPGL